MKNRRMRRSRLELYIEVLKVAKTVHSPTKIMSSAGLLWWMMTRDIFPRLIKQGLLTVESTGKGLRRLYHLTDAGQAVIDLHDKLKKMLGDGV